MKVKQIPVNSLFAVGASLYVKINPSGVEITHCLQIAQYNYESGYWMYLSPSLPRDIESEMSIRVGL